MQDAVGRGDTFFLAFGFGVLMSCTRDKIPQYPTIQEPSKWKKIEGKYKVYDTLGSYLYEMEIIHIFNETINKDTLIFKNLHNQFNLYSWQSYLPNNVNPFSIFIGPEDPIFDKQNNRWQLITYGFSDGCNIWKNDTIIMKFGLINIKYWIEDAKPYLDTIIKQVAVKQH
jgi:hypothetical protein